MWELGLRASAPYSGSEFDLAAGEWIRLTSPVERKKAAKCVPPSSSRKKSEKGNAFDDLSSALQDLNAYAETLKNVSGDEIRKLAGKIRKLIR